MHKQLREITKNFQKKFSDDKTYSFRIHNINKLTQKYINKININPVNKEASVLKLNVKASNPKKHIDFINKLTELYIKMGLDEKIRSHVFTSGEAALNYLRKFYLSDKFFHIGPYRDFD